MAEPEYRRTGDDGGKFYEHPSRTEDEPGPGGSIIVRPARYDSVTWALNIRNKEALVFWSANLAARRAMAELPKLLAAALIPDCGRARAKTEPFGCKVCEACIEAWVALFHHGEKSRRAREGTAAHDVLEHWIATGKWVYRPVTSGDPAIDQYVPTQEHMAPYIKALQAWVADYGLTPEDFQVSECTVWNHRLRYAGTLDFIVVIEPRTRKAAELCARINFRTFGAEVTPEQLLQPVTVLGDCKSREGEGAELYTEHPLQGVAYRNAETMTLKGAAPEMERPMMPTDAFVLLQVRPDGYTFRPLLTEGQEMRTFEAVLHDARWERDRGGEAILVRAFPLPDDWKWVDPATPKKTTRARKAAPKKVTAPAATPEASPSRSAIINSLHQTAPDDLFDLQPDGIPF
jgi:hypothetical protein